MSKYIPITNNVSITNYIMSYIIGEKPCEYLKNIVHYYILNELQLFNLSRYHVHNRHYVEDIYNRECVYQIHDYLLNNKTDNKILVSSTKRGILKQIRKYCTITTFNIHNSFYVYKRTIQQTLHLNKDAYMDYNYNEEYVW